MSDNGLVRGRDGLEVYVMCELPSNIILADEINRAPAKVQSALLEAMQERQVTLGDETHILDDPFMVLATQNPIEQEGTYPLPEAQVDRFMMKVVIDYPSIEEERRILDSAATTERDRRNTRSISRISRPRSGRGRGAAPGGRRGAAR